MLRRASLVLLALAAVCPAPVCAAPRALALDTASEVGLDALSTRLLENRAEPLKLEALLRGLRLDPQVTLESLFDTLRRRKFTVRVGERGRSDRSLTRFEERVLISALGQRPWDDVREHLELVRAGEVGTSHRITALSLLAAYGTGSDLPLFLSWAQSEDEKPARSVEYAFGRALTRFLERKPETAARVPSLYRDADRRFLHPILEALGRTETPEALRALSQMLGIVPAADALVFGELSDLGQRLPHPVEEPVRRRVRGYLESNSKDLRVEAILACESLGDTDAVVLLFDHLQDPSEDVRRLARRSLESITGQEYAYETDKWRKWFQRIGEWKELRMPDAARTISSGAPELARTAILECSKHRYLRHELTPIVAMGLVRGEQDVVIAACAALGHLGSPASVPDLLFTLDRADPSIRRAALLALRRVTGEDHGEKPSDWVRAGW